MEEEPSKGTVNCSIPHHYRLSSAEHNGPCWGLMWPLLLQGENGSTHGLRIHKVQIGAGGSRGKGARAPPADWSMLVHAVTFLKEVLCSLKQVWCSSDPGWALAVWAGAVKEV